MLFWLGHERPPFRRACYTLASVGDGLYAALAAAQTTSYGWFKDLLDRARTDRAASAIAMALLPKAPAVLRDRWIRNVKTEPGLAYEAVRWSKHTWPGGRWLELRQRLRAAGISDKARWWYHWWRDIEPDPSAHDYLAVDPLWCAELVIDFDLPTLPEPVRNRLWRELATNRNSREALLLLRWCQTRRKAQPQEDQ